MPWDQQLRHPCRLEWGLDGARRAGSRGDVVIVVDALDFATAVAYGVAEDLDVMACIEDDDLEVLARRHRAEIAQCREAEGGGLTLAPLSLSGQSFERVLLRSPVAALCTRATVDAGAVCVFVGAFVNAGAVAQRAIEAMGEAAGLTLVACGSRWTSSDNLLRVAVEDELAAGCIIARLRAAAGRGHDSRWTSPEARVAEQAWRGVERTDELVEILRTCVSGLELRRRGFDVRVGAASRVDVLEVAPKWRDGWLVDANR